MQRFACRWCVKGITPTFGACTTVFDLSTDRRRISVYPGATDYYTVLLDKSLVTRLHECLADDAPVEVTGLRIGAERRSLGIRLYRLPTAHSGPVALYASTPKARIQVIYQRESLLALKEAFAEMATAVLE